MSQKIEIFNAYFKAIAEKDFETLTALFSDDVVWYQPCNGIQSKNYRGKTEIFKLYENFINWSNGTFTIDNVDYVAESAQLVTASINFKSRKRDKSFSMSGIDLFRVEGNQIKEIWLFSERIGEEDDFWTYAAKN